MGTPVEDWLRKHIGQTARAGLGGTSPSAASYRPQDKLKAGSPEEMMRQAKDMLDTQEAQHSYSLQQGPSVGQEQPPAWLRKEMEKNDTTQGM